MLMSMEQLGTWGFMTDIPPGPGGDQPSLEGKVATCERCGQPFQVKRMKEADECVYHWGKPYSTKINGEQLSLLSWIILIGRRREITRI